MPMPLLRPFAYLFLLAIPIACLSWTMTHEEVFREPRDWCREHSWNCHRMAPPNFFIC